MKLWTRKAIEVLEAIPMTGLPPKFYEGSLRRMRDSLTAHRGAMSP